MENLQHLATKEAVEKTCTCCRAVNLSFHAPTAATDDLKEFVSDPNKPGAIY
jgi:hypothetical protein